MGSVKGRADRELNPWGAPRRPKPAPTPRDEPRKLQTILVGILAGGVAFAIFAFAPGTASESSGDPVAAAAVDGKPATTAPAGTGATSTLSSPSTYATTSSSRPPGTIIATTTASTASTTTSTTTTAPPTTVSEITTTTAAPTTTLPPRNLLVRDISTSRLSQGGSWVAIATVTVQDDQGQLAGAAAVRASWSIGDQTSSCTTDGTGKCSLYLYGIELSVDSVVLTLAEPSAGLTRTINKP